MDGVNSLVENSSAETIDQSFSELKQQAPKLALRSVAERAGRLQKIVAYIQDNLPDFEQAMQADLRRHPLDTKAELLMVKAEAEHAIKHLAAWLKPNRVRNSLMSMGTDSYTIYEPKGVALIIAPWNAPFACTLIPLVGAIAAGNAVMLKPSEIAPHSSAVLRQMIAELYPPNEVALVEGDATVATHLLSLPIDHIYFTGSPAIGKIVMKAAAEHLTSITLELGGKSPTIVDDSAEIESAAYKIAWGKCANVGQACVAPDYVLVQESVADQFLACVKDAVATMYADAAKSSAYCRIISRKHFDRIKGLVDDALAKGATLYLGGEMDADDLYIAPTVLADVTPDMRIMQEEVFGPVLPIMTWQTRDEAIAHINAMPKPLAMYIYSTNEEAIEELIARTSAGSTVVNHNMIQAGLNPRLPFGGVGNSGMGRSVGKATFESFANLRSVVKQPSGRRDTYKLSLPPYSKTYQRMINFLFGA
jgi:aldehyde dehydrogenase (NAD+)